MGGTGATFVDDYGAVHANPAGLSRARDREFSLGLSVAGFDLTLNQQHVAADPGRASIIGLTLPLPLGGVLRRRVAVGVGFFTPLSVVVRGRILRPETPQFVNLPDRVQSVAIQLGAGVDLGYGIRLGGGVAALAGLTGSVVVATDPSGRASSRIDDQLVASYAPVLGGSFDVGPLRFAVVYRGELIARFLVSIEARDLGVTIPRLNISGVAQYDPSQVHFEAAYTHRQWLFAAAGTYKQWSAWPGPAEATTEGSTPPPAPEFSDTLVLRAGAERRFDLAPGQRFAARLGYLFEPTPAPAASASRSYVDNTRHAITAGLGMSAEALGTRLSLDLAVQYHVLVARAGETGGPGESRGSVVASSLTAGVTF